MRAEAGAAAMCSQHTACQALPATPQEPEEARPPFPRADRGRGLATPSFWLLKSKTVREYIFVLSHPVCIAALGN